MAMKMIPLDAQLNELLARQINGRGGYQSLLRSLQRSRTGKFLALDPVTSERVVRYAEKYGDGGFQERLVELADLIQEAL